MNRIPLVVACLVMMSAMIIPIGGAPALAQGGAGSPLMAPPAQALGQPSAQPVDPLGLTDKQKVAIGKVRTTVSAQIERVLSNSGMSDRQKAAAVVRLDESAKQQELAVLTPHQRTIALAAEQHSKQSDPLHITPTQNAEVIVIRYKLGQKYKAIMADKSMTQPQKQAAVQSLAKQEQTLKLAILTAAQRKTLDKIRAQQALSGPPH